MDSVCNIRIYDRDFNWVNVTEQAESVQFERELYGAGKFQIKIHPDKQGALDLIRRGSIIVINNNTRKSGIMRDFTITESRGESFFMVYGETGNGLMRQRIAVPPNETQVPGAMGWDRIRANTETVLKHYVNRNLVNPFAAGRKIPRLEIAPDLQRGIEMPSQLRFTPLADDMYNIALFAEMGFEIYADVENQRWVFDVIEGADRTVNQEELSPVTFNIENQNIDEYRYIEDYQNYKNTGYAGGQGENENRLVQIIGAENTGLDRFETFIDCGSADLTDLLHYGNLRLAEFAAVKTLEAKALPKVFIFDKDYFLGDKITAYISRLGLELPVRVTAVKEIWERQLGHRKEVRFGDKVPNIFTILEKTEGIR